MAGPSAPPLESPVAPIPLEEVENASDSEDLGKPEKETKEDEIIDLALEDNEEDEVEPDYLEDGFEKVMGWLHVLLENF